MRRFSTKSQKVNNLFVIGCGFPKTGIGSLSVALSELGFISYNQRNLQKTRHHIPLWHHASDLKAQLRDENNIKSFNDWSKITFSMDDFNWNEIFEIDHDSKQKYNAIISGAATAFYLDIMKFYESEGYDVRIILTYKSLTDLTDINNNYSFENINKYKIGNEWYSNKEWIARPISQTMGLTVAQSCVGNLLFNDNSLMFFDNENNCKIQYKEWIDSVIKNVNKDKLLLFNVDDGYEPLCQFLNGMHIPQYVDFEPKPFPHVNDSMTTSPLKKLLQYFS
eukprot:317052_1